MRRIALMLACLLVVNTTMGEEAVPDGFVVQELKPTGGRILRPKDWHFVQAHRNKTLMWTLSKEDPQGGKVNYDTGFRIQFFAEIKARAKQSPEELMKSYYDQKKEAADEVHKECEPSKQGIFQRICLQTTEGEHRIQYSMFYNNEADMAAVTTAGSKKDEWDQYRDIFDRMNAFTLYEPKAEE